MLGGVGLPGSAFVVDQHLHAGDGARQVALPGVNQTQVPVQVDLALLVVDLLVVEQRLLVQLGRARQVAQALVNQAPGWSGF